MSATHSALSLPSSSITRFHDHLLSQPAMPFPSFPSAQEEGAWRWISANHRYNTLLWKEEDKARRMDVADAEIATSKRLIDQYNQRRNDAIEALDEVLLAALAPCERKRGAPA